MNYRTMQFDLNWAPLIFTQFEPHVFTCSEPCCAHIKRPVFWKLPGLGISNIISDSRCDVVCIWYNDNFSRGRAAKIKCKQFSEFGSRISLHRPVTFRDGFSLLGWSKVKFYKTKLTSIFLDLHFLHSDLLTAMKNFELYIKNRQVDWDSWLAVSNAVSN